MSDSFRGFSSGLYVYRANIGEADEPGPHVWYEHAGNPRERDGSGPIIPPDRLDFRYLNEFRADMMIWRRVGPQDYFFQ